MNQYQGYFLFSEFFDLKEFKNISGINSFEFTSLIGLSFLLVCHIFINKRFSFLLKKGNE